MQQRKHYYYYCVFLEQNDWKDNFAICLPWCAAAARAKVFNYVILAEKTVVRGAAAAADEIGSFSLLSFTPRVRHHHHPFARLVALFADGSVNSERRF